MHIRRELQIRLDPNQLGQLESVLESSLSEEGELVPRKRRRGEKRGSVVEVKQECLETNQ